MLRDGIFFEIGRKEFFGVISDFLVLEYDFDFYFFNSKAKFLIREENNVVVCSLLILRFLCRFYF